MHDPIQRVEFVNAPKPYLLKRSRVQRSRGQWITERNTTSVRLIVCLKKLTFAFSSSRLLRYVFWLNDTSYIKSVWRDKQELAC